jgi:phytoene dehydrogenase-like protein
MGSHGEVVIVGGGLAGLCAARVLARARVSCTIFEASDDIGGRVRSDNVRGFVLDRGFQFFLTAYPEAKNVLFYESLGLRPFAPGARIRLGERFVDFGRASIKTMLSRSVGTLSDRLKLRALRRELRQLSIDQIWQRPQATTIDALRQRGFSDRIIERFFGPFFGGIFFDRSLSTSRRKFDFTLRMLADGDMALPEAGMGAIPRHLAARLRDLDFRLDTKVARADENGVTLAGGQRIMARAVIVATDQTSAGQLIDPQSAPAPRGWRGTTCLYFAADKPPIDDPVIVPMATVAGRSITWPCRASTALRTRRRADNSFRRT